MPIIFLSTLSGNSYNLHIVNVQNSDAGDYECSMHRSQAENPVAGFGFAALELK